MMRIDMGLADGCEEKRVIFLGVHGENMEHRRKIIIV